MAATLAVSAFQGVMLGIFVAFLVMILALGRWSTRSAAQYLDWRPTRSADVEARNDDEDLAQMLAAQNASRRRRGLPERTLADVRADVRRTREELAARAPDRHPGRDPWRAP